VAFGADGTLYILTSACESDAAQSYTLIARPRSGPERTVAVGQTLGSFGDFAVLPNGLAYVAYERSAAGSQAQAPDGAGSASSLWYWEQSSGARTRLVDVPDPIGAIGH
jgi:hypothetical protein